ncbi:MAG: hypothetical protein AAGA56_24715 [Myxococcota bacterium]
MRWQIAGLLALGLWACTDPAGEADCVCGEAASAPVVDSATLAFLSKAKAAHQQADLAEAEDKVGLAVQRLGAIVDGPRPGGERAEVREVLADALARRADLRSRQGDYRGALGDVDQGLLFVPRRTLFRGRLMEVRGAVEQRRFEELELKGDAAGAKAAKRRAIEALETAVSIQDEVIQAALGEPEAP